VLFILWWRDSQAGRADDNLRPIGASGVRIAGTTIDGRPVSPPSAGPESDVLTWEQVEEEFARLEREASHVTLGDETA
jgi:hypothetical protein